MVYLNSKAFLLLGLVFAIVAPISSEISAREQVPSQTYESDAIAMQETDINAELRHEELSFQRNQRHRNSFIQYQSGYYCCRQPNMK
ncbi:hypothetical protein CMV_013571 [Castanea mollissima]|uniref:Uncharacterized protein n=1 Tax=Castanea mollissima TaxID=60419 RepID=A0A8J4VI37_9ROSI|nr:hypothetical protein CMV_013571 [Castanea mollissima]